MKHTFICMHCGVEHSFHGDLKPEDPRKFWCSVMCFQLYMLKHPLLVFSDYDDKLALLEERERLT